mmetsp:Transcript_106045/g.316718  ORF Transcript_106045/g.316718 Transcript_106045/m.316718 type:complete len:233 (-) Transcript_106045:28-726(-)
MVAGYLALQQELHWGRVRAGIQVATQDYSWQFGSTFWSMLFSHLLNLQQQAHDLQQPDVTCIRMEEEVRVGHDNDLPCRRMLHHRDLEDGRHVWKHPVKEVRPLCNNLAEDFPASWGRPQEGAEEVLLLLEDLKGVLAYHEDAPLGGLAGLQGYAKMIALAEYGHQELPARRVAALLQEHEVPVQALELAANQGLAVRKVESMRGAVGIHVPGRHLASGVDSGKRVPADHTQ